VVALLVTATVGALLAMARKSDDRVWAVRLRMPVASGELLGSEAIEAVHVALPDLAGVRYITPTEAAAGLTAASDLRAGDLLSSNDVVAVPTMSSADSTSSSPQTSRPAMVLMAGVAAALFVGGVFLGRFRTRPVEPAEPSELDLAEAMAQPEPASVPALIEQLPEPVDDRPPLPPPTVALPPVMRPNVLLRVFGQPNVEGASISQALAAPFVVAAAGRPMTGDEIAELTGYSKKTLSSVFTTGHPVLARVGGKLELAPDVYTEHAWVDRCAHLAADALRAGREHDAIAWLRAGFAVAYSFDGAPYERPNGRATAWRWVDDYPVDISARADAEQAIVAAVLTGIDTWLSLGTLTEDDAEPLVDLTCRLARAVPYAPVVGQAWLSEWPTSAPALLVAGHLVARTADQIKRVADTAALLVSHSIIDPSDDLADALELPG
jgi:hypothetical protein